MVHYQRWCCLARSNTARKERSAASYHDPVSLCGRQGLSAWLELKFPAHTSSIQISYAAISLSGPTAVHFRYKLQESDKDWHEVASASPVSTAILLRAPIILV